MERKRRQLNERYLANLFLFHRQRMIEEWSVPEERLIPLNDKGEIETPLRQKTTPLLPGWVIHPKTHKLIKIPKDHACQRNIDGTPVHIKADGEPVFYKVGND